MEFVVFDFVNGLAEDGLRRCQIKQVKVAEYVGIILITSLGIRLQQSL